jgi:hypothetical protein
MPSSEIQCKQESRSDRVSAMRDIQPLVMGQQGEELQPGFWAQRVKQHP